MPLHHVLQREYLSRGGKKREIMVKILAGPSVQGTTDIRAMYGRKGVKRVLQI